MDYIYVSNELENASEEIMTLTSRNLDFIRVFVVINKTNFIRIF